MTPGINPIYAGLKRSCPRDSKNVSYVDVRLEQTCLDLIESYGWWGGGLSKNLVKPWAQQFPPPKFIEISDNETVYQKYDE